MPAQQQRPTLEEVAASAGVSRATVSRVVNNSPTVAPHLRERVEQAIRELGYRPNLAARSLVTRRTGAVGVVVAESAEFVFADPFFGPIVRAASRELARTGRQMVLLLAQDEQDHERIAQYLEGGHVDGALLFSLHRNDPLPEVAARLGLPVVLQGRPWDAGPLRHWVDNDNRGGGRTATRYLLEQGRSRIATITGPLDMPAAVDRLSGYREALGNQFDDRLVVAGDFRQESGEAGMRELLERAPDIDGVFAASDLMAVGALRALRRSGRKVPEDVAVVGFDDHAALDEWTDPPLTSVHQDIDGAVVQMVSLLGLMLDGEEAPQHVVLPTRLVVRASA
ncbi:LacI family DNA-binding transcriptional regulator [Motilibacter rhizosphaerae]